MWCVPRFTALFGYLINTIETVGENPSMWTVHNSSDITVNCFLGNIYDGTRMDTIWAFRQGYLFIVLQTFLSLFKK